MSIPLNPRGILIQVCNLCSVLPVLKKMVDSGEINLTSIITTHHHGDHAYGNQVWVDNGATPVAHTGVVEEMRKYEPGRWNDTAKTRPDGSPVYQVWLKGQNGRLDPMVGANGVTLTWYPDWKTSAEYRRRQDAQQGTVDSARRQRQQMAAPPGPDASASPF